MRRPELAAAVGAALAAAAVACWPGAAAAAEPVPTAWWHVLRQTTPVGALPAAPIPDDGSLPVQNGPAGALAISAVRFAVGDATAGTLTLAYAGQAPAVPPVVDLCPARTHWTEGPNQEWDARPSYDCGTHVAGTPGSAGMVWKVSAALIRDGDLDVVLVPEAGDPTPYAVSFAAPTTSALALAPAEPAPSPPPPPSGNTAGAGPGTAGGANSAAPDLSGSAPVAAAPAPVAAPVVAPAAGNSAGVAAPQVAPVAAVTGGGSRTVGAATLGGAAVLLMLRGFTGGRPRAGRSLLPNGQET